jgi:hypothetical protein
MNKAYYEIIFYAICFLAILCGVFFTFNGDYSLSLKIYFAVIVALFIGSVVIWILKKRK